MGAIRSISIVLIVAVAAVRGGGITVEQMQQATEPVRLVCMQKSKVSEASLASMRAGSLDDAKEFKCYVNCVFEMMQLVKKGKINIDSVYRNIETLVPEVLQEGTKRAVGKCKDKGMGTKDFCEAAHRILKCLYEEYPDFYFP